MIKIQGKILGIVLMFSIFATAATLSNIQNNLMVFAQSTNSTNSTGGSGNNQNSSLSSDIGNAINTIKGGDNTKGKTDLMKIEGQMEGKSGLSGAEKHIEAAISALKDGDTNGAINHAQEAQSALNK
jgi:hypothetical protein